MKKSLSTVAAIAMMALGTAAFADNHEGGKGAEWKGLSDAEKLQRIEERRAEHRKKMDEKWNAMSDSEKIDHVETKMKKRKERRQEQQSEE